MKAKIGTSFEMVVIKLIMAADCTPRRIKKCTHQRITLAPIIDATFCPSPNAGMKYPTALNSSVPYATLPRRAANQYPSRC